MHAKPYCSVSLLTTQVIIFTVYRRRARTQPPANQRLIGPVINNAENSGSQVAGLRLRPDERIKYTDNDYGEVESVIDENSRLLEDNESATQAEASRLLGEGNPSALPSGDDSIWRNEHSRSNPVPQGRS